MQPENIVVSSDESYFLDYWPLVSAAWRKFFDCKIHLAFVTNRDALDPTVVRLERHGTVHLLKPLAGIPTANHAKMARYIVAAHLDGISTVHDIDSIPLQSNYTFDLLAQRKPDTLLIVGQEVYRDGHNDGKFPTSYLTAEGKIWREFLGDETAALDKWRLSAEHDHKEAMANPPMFFSDESLLRRLVLDWVEPKITFVEKGIEKTQLIDRSNWEIRRDQLLCGEYIEANLPRPLYDHIVMVWPIFEYLIMGKA
jgi:hypothetical protein